MTLEQKLEEVTHVIHDLINPLFPSAENIRLNLELSKQDMFEEMTQWEKDNFNMRMMTGEELKSKALTWDMKTATHFITLYPTIKKGSIMITLTTENVLDIK